MYTDQVMDHFYHPRNLGTIEHADAVGVAGNPKCGDIMQITLRVEDGIITDAKFKVFGCGAAVATSSMATELIKGRTVEQAFTLTNDQVAQALGGLPLHKMHCSVLAEQAIKAAIGDYYVRQGILSPDEVQVYDDPHGEDTPDEEV
ncbi:iron-sulfur cluster assembly scaffold protein [Pseudoflavonifractor sp. DSM 107456]|uniref:Iron-sulfur cluster assembly scaffold protein n=2 Tax=Pseudoflavonifractor TaxID=1017280 RepID=A0ABR9R865_9FIRM|nr:MULTISPECIES: iron-sulfur cluster assembly scaffold protein [Eubacteriales]MBC5729639.1 iron-sulfur cluster assembly scaffold protein [Pseudoflavonifractor hominis]MBE5054882.1 iron-sulfur cluster assembly scaffold protein [Pseudoflavonifractor gallinarum]MBS5135524.1 iron-sulfur cluster assembly scaffold protein [Oscillospiraceae bacterium]MBT9685203.1 iron-sulfur cluster assembly scaffold protein [Pseudoflavonifractor sp. MCC625]